MSNFFAMGNNITKLQFKAGIAIKDDDTFLKKYDKNNNSIFDSEEVEEFYQDLEEFAGENSVLETEETVRWYSKITGKSVDVVCREFMENNQVYNSIDILLQKQLRGSAIRQISKEADEAYQIYENAVGGYVSKGYNGIKELFNTEYAGDKVYRQIAAKKVSSFILEKASCSNLKTAK